MQSFLSRTWLRTAHVFFQASSYSSLSPFLTASSSSSNTFRRLFAQAVTSMTPALARNPAFAIISDKDLDYFKQILPQGAVITDPDDLHFFNTDWLGKYIGNSNVALKPKTTEQVSQILKYCNERKIAVVPQGGNTGLVGGSTPVFDEIILSLANMNQIIGFDQYSSTITCEAGCILETLDQYVRQHNHIMPIDLGAKGSCHIGGNVAANAGGIRYVRYGSLKAAVLGMQVVLADGTILDHLSTSLKKDNTGYDLKQLMIGSEGTLGIITALKVACPPKSDAVNAALVGCQDFEAIKKLLTVAKSDLGEILSAFEFMDGPVVELAKKHLHGLKDPFQGESYPFYALIETSGSNQQHDSEKLDAFLEKIFTEEIVLNGVVAQDKTQLDSFWHLREGLPEATSKAGKVYKYDVSIPLDDFYKLVEETRNILKNTDAIVVGWGHIGDGNLHLNVAAPEYSPKYTNLLEPFVYEWLKRHKGSISAEHGVGVMKADKLLYSKPSVSIDLMQRIKKVFDPNGILNPYKVLPNTNN